MGRDEQATVADHIIPHKEDRELFFHGELQSLCAECHSTTKQREEITGKRAGCDIDGNPLSGW